MSWRCFLSFLLFHLFTLLFFLQIPSVIDEERTVVIFFMSYRKWSYLVHSAADVLLLLRFLLFYFQFHSRLLWLLMIEVSWPVSG